MARIVLFFSILCLLKICSGQTHKLYGQVVDENDDPIPYAHIQLKGTTLGTITNGEGLFTLYIPSEYSTLNTIQISSIGYKPREITISKEFEKIYLREDIVELREVSITPRDYARELIEQAINQIPKNYASSQYQLKGFLREKAFWKSSGRQMPLYIAESVIESFKASYTKEHDKGKVRMIEGRKFTNEGIDTLRMRFYGGPHHPHRFDVVAARKEFLKKPANFQFEIIDTTRYSDLNLYEIRFNHKRGSPSGEVFVLDSTFAIVKANFEYDYDFSFPILDLLDKDRIFLAYNTKYYLGNNEKWILEQTQYHTQFRQQGDTIILESEYATTSYTQTEAGIPYPDRIQYRDIFLDNTGEYDSTFWNNYNIILPDSTTEKLFKKQVDNPVKEGVKRRKFFDILSRMRTSLTLDYSPLTQKAHSISFSNSEFNINESNEKSNNNALSLSSTIQYEWKPSLFLGLNTSIPLTNPSNSFIDLQLIKEINLNSNGRPIFLSPGLTFGYQQLSKKIGSFESESSFSVDGKKFDSGSTDIFLQQKGFRILPTLTFGIEKSHQLQYFISAGYNIPIKQKAGLYFDETDQFFLRQKNAFLKNGEEGLTIQSTSSPFDNTWTFSAGVYLSF